MRNLKLKSGLLIIVDHKDKSIGYQPKDVCHQAKGLLHRAFSVFIFNHRRQLLLQKRGPKKSLWPGWWSNTCCSHPKKGEVIKKAAEKRLKEEMGFGCPLHFLGKLKYQDRYQGIGSENEITYIFVGHYSGQVKPNKNEVTASKWIALEKLKEAVGNEPAKYTPWLKLIIEKFKLS